MSALHAVSVNSWETGVVRSQTQGGGALRVHVFPLGIGRPRFPLIVNPVASLSPLWLLFSRLLPLSLFTQLLASRMGVQILGRIKKWTPRINRLARSLMVEPGSLSV